MYLPQSSQVKVIVKVPGPVPEDLMCATYPRCALEPIDQCVEAVCLTECWVILPDETSGQ